MSEDDIRSVVPRTIKFLPGEEIIEHVSARKTVDPVVDDDEEQSEPRKSFPILDIPDDALRPIADYQGAYEWVESDRLWVATIPAYRGVIATGETHVACRDDLIEVLREWLSLGYFLHHELPTIEGIDYGQVATR